MALYHRHRPQDFDSVIGQEHIIETIQQQIKNSAIGHAYLFSGPRGVGKTTTARILAKAVNCPIDSKTGEIDNQSDLAREINESRCIDVIEIDAASHTGVDNVRQNIIENAQFKPTKCKKKVFIIDEVHMLSTAAFNALLKILEEPPAYVLFILATTELHKLPVTVVSRCQRFTFKRVPFDVIEKHLVEISKKEDVEVADEVLHRIAHKSEGCVRDAVSLLDQVISLGKKKITLTDIDALLPTSALDVQLTFVSALAKKDSAAAWTTLTKILEQGTYVERFAEELIELLRYLMVYSINPSFVEKEFDLNKDEKIQFNEVAAQLPIKDTVQLADLLMKRKAQISASPIPQLPLEMLILEWTGGFETAENTKVEQTTSQPIKKEIKHIAVEQQTPPLVAEVTETLVEEISNEEIKSPEPIQEGPIDKSHTLFSKWTAVVHEVERKHPSLAFILKMVEVVKVEKDQLFLKTGYSFHKEKLDESTCRKNVEAIIQAIVGTPLVLQVELNEQAVTARHNAELDELANAFGGEVIN